MSVTISVFEGRGPFKRGPGIRDARFFTVPLEPPGRFKGAGGGIAREIPATAGGPLSGIPPHQYEVQFSAAQGEIDIRTSRASKRICVQQSRSYEVWV
jgi:hypothetical protein